MKTISLRVSNEYDRRIRLAAAACDLNRSDFIREAVDAKLSAEGSTQPKDKTPQAEVSNVQG